VVGAVPRPSVAAGHKHPLVSFLLCYKSPLCRPAVAAEAEVAHKRGPCNDYHIPTESQTVAGMNHIRFVPVNNTLAIHTKLAFAN
jgi:hypothetical protein